MVFELLCAHNEALPLDFLFSKDKLNMFFSVGSRTCLLLFASILARAQKPAVSAAVETAAIDLLDANRT